jgi:AraC family transcriptional regulator
MAKLFLQSRISSGVTLSELARVCGLSVGYFSRAFRATFGITVHRRMMQLRVHHAQLLLRDSERPISGIAREVGFMDQAAFTKCFAEMAGFTPGRYRRFVRTSAVSSDLARVPSFLS